MKLGKVIISKKVKTSLFTVIASLVIITAVSQSSETFVKVSVARGASYTSVRNLAFDVDWINAKMRVKDVGILISVTCKFDKEPTETTLDIFELENDTFLSVNGWRDRSGEYHVGRTYDCIESKELYNGQFRLSFFEDGLYYVFYIQM